MLNTIITTYLTPKCSCIECGIEISTKGIATHYIRKHTNFSTRPTGKGTNKFQLRCSCLLCKKETAVQSLEQHIVKCTKPKHKCLQCDNLTKTKFCSHTCSATYNNKLKYPNNTGSIPIKDPGKINSKFFFLNGKINYSKISWCKICNKLIPNSSRATCSDECKAIIFRQAGCSSAAKVVRRSVDEITLYELCHSYFTSVRHNIQLVDGWDADIIIDDHKIAVLWNGPWHYKQMPHKTHSLLQVQNRDRLKIKALTSDGWKIMIFEDRNFTPQTAYESILMQGQESNLRRSDYEPELESSPVHPASKYSL